MSDNPTKRTKFSQFGFPSSAYSRLDNTAKIISNKKDKDTKEYEMLKKSTSVPDYTDLAYREAVSRLRYMLNEYYVPSSVKYSIGGYNKQDESCASSPVGDRTRTNRLSPFRRPLLPQRTPTKFQQSSSKYYDSGCSEADNPDTVKQSSPELIAFIERQEEYIDQLEKEAQYCRDELSNLLGKVKELILENESLHDQQKRGMMKVMLEGMDEERINEFQSPRKIRKPMEGPLIVFESRISELEAQLTQTRLDLRKAQEEAETYKKKLNEAQPSSTNYDFYKQIENLQREKRDLNESLAKLQASINQIREKEMDASKKVQKTLDVVDKTQFEKQQAEMEVYRLKSELELQHDKLLEVLSEQTRKVADERSQAERRYHQHVERLNGELTATRDALAKVQMELEKHQRMEEDLKRDLNSKNLTIDNVKKEFNTKIGNLQKELSSALAERDSLEQELNTSKMSVERSERLNRQEVSRLQVEISALKKRLDDGDANLIHTRRENLRLLEKISDLENELTLYKIKLGEQRDPIEDEEQKAREKIINSRISEIEAKHVERVSDLEGLIENQSQVMAQLKAECQSLTQKLEESTARHKKEMDNLQNRLNNLNTKMDSNLEAQQPWTIDEASKEPETIASSYQNLTESNTFSHVTSDPISYNQRFLSEESRNAGYEYGSGSQAPSTHEITYIAGKDIPHEVNNKISERGNVDGDGGISVGSVISGATKEPELNQYFNNQAQYSNYYQSDLQPSSNYQDQSFKEQTIISYQEKPLDQTYREQQQQPSHQEQPGSYLGQTYNRDQQVFQIKESEPVTSKTKIVEESYNVVTPVVQHPISQEPLEKVAPEPKPPPPDLPKSAASQRFQRAAELSRQAGKMEETTRGRLTTQARTRNTVASRLQSKPPSRFK